MSSLLTSTLKGKQSTVVNAYLENDTTILVRLADPLTFPFEVSDVTMTDTTTGKVIPVIKVTLPQAYVIDPSGEMQPVLGVSGEQRPAVPAGVQTDLIEVMLVEAPKVTHSLQIALNG